MIKFNRTQGESWFFYIRGTFLGKIFAKDKKEAIALARESFGDLDFKVIRGL